MTKCLPHFQGAILGAAIGDSLGFLTEKKPISETQLFVDTFLKTKTYSIPFRTYPKNYLFGQYSDDTQFSRYLILSLLECNGFDSQNYFNKLLVAFNEGSLVGLGTNTNKIFKAATSKKDLSNLINNNSNGSLMRSYPIGLFFSTEAEILDHSSAQSKLTHNTDEAIKSCQLMALTIHHLKNHSMNSLLDFWKSNNFLNLDFNYLNLSFTEAQEFIHSISPNKEWQYVSPSAKATLAAVFYITYNFQRSSFSDALLKAISLGGDTDSVASLVGAVMGFHHGSGSLPSYWNNMVHDEGNFGHQYLINLSQKLYHYVK